MKKAPVKKAVKKPIKKKAPKKKSPPKNKGGRPTKYDPKFCVMIIRHFSIKPFFRKELKHYDKNGDYRWSDYKTMSNAMPTFLGFATKIGVDDDTLENWAKEENKDKYPGFFGAYIRAKVLQKNFLIENGLNGSFNPQFAIFVAKNITDMKDKQELDTKHSGEIKVIRKSNL